MLFHHFIAEIEESWKVYKMWSALPDTVKECWIEAAKTIHAYNELAKTIPDKVGMLFYVNYFLFSICFNGFVKS